MVDSLLATAELELIVERYETTLLHNIGKKKWFKQAEILFKLYQIATIESTQSSHIEERIVKVFILFNKIEKLIREVVTLSLWKEKVFPELVKLLPKPENAFPTYIVLYNEIIILGILQSILFHPNAFNYIGDSTNDLIDYAIGKLAKLAFCKSSLLSSDDIRKRKLDPIDELIEQRSFIDFNLGSQCVAVLRYVSENLDKLPLGAASRIYTTHDLPILVTHLLDNEVWSTYQDGKFHKFNENSWKEWLESDPVLSKTECQVWLLLRQLLINPACDTVYYYSTFRKEQLSKLIKLLHGSVIDQLSPLEDLKNWLNTLLLNPTKGSDVHNPLIVEIENTAVDDICKEYDEMWKDIAVKRSKLLFYPKQGEMQVLAKSFSDCFDVIEELTDQVQSCVFCFSRAFKRCSRCKTAWYCSRKCQVEHWPAHKSLCN